jgi:voltage-dependent calcium channel
MLKFIHLFQKLSGIFEVRIYPVEFSTPNIMAACNDTRDSEHSPSSKVVDGIDTNKLRNVLKGIDYAAVRRRRNMYSRLYHEASISHQQGKGISFTDMLLLLAHHKLIVDREALMYVTVFSLVPCPTDPNN